MTQPTTYPNNITHHIHIDIKSDDDRDESILVDTNGHFSEPDDLYGTLKEGLQNFFDFKIKHHYSENMLMDFAITCPDCGESLEIVSKSEDHISMESLSREQCNGDQYKNDIAFDIPVPSGKMVFANDMSSLFALNNPFARENSPNHAKGRYHRSKQYADQGVAMFYTDNACISILLSENNTDVILHRMEDEDNEDNEGNDEMTHLWPFDFDPMTLKGHIFTAPPFTMMTDINNFKQACIDKNVDYDTIIESLNAVVVDVESGIYRCKNTHAKDEPAYSMYTKKMSNH